MINWVWRQIEAGVSDRMNIGWYEGSWRVGRKTLTIYIYSYGIHDGIYSEDVKWTVRYSGANSEGINA